MALSLAWTTATKPNPGVGKQNQPTTIALNALLKPNSNQPVSNLIKLSDKTNDTIRIKHSEVLTVFLD